MRTKNIDAIFMVRLRQKEFMHRLQTHTKRMDIESKGNSNENNVFYVVITMKEFERSKVIQFLLEYLRND